MRTIHGAKKRLKSAHVLRYAVDQLERRILLASTQVLADSVGDLSGTQGSNHWYYGYQQNGAFQEFPTYGNDLDFPSSGSAWYESTGAGGYWTALWADGGHPNGTNGNQGRLQVEQFADRRWISPIDGQISITGNYGAENGGAMNVVVELNGTSMFSANAGTTGTYDLTATVHKGSILDFLIEAPNDNDVNGATELTATIELISSTITSAIGVQFVQAGPALTQSQAAGVVSQDNYNTVHVNNSSGTSGTTSDLLDSDGNATGITLTHDSNDGYNSNTDTTTPNGILLHGEDKSGPAGHSSSDGPGLTATYTFNNVPIGYYDLIAYTECDYAGVNANLTVGNVTYFVVDESVASGTPIFAIANNTNSANRITGNYVEFFNVVPVSQAISLTNTSEGGANDTAAINGFQLIPESIATLGTLQLWMEDTLQNYSIGGTIDPELTVTDSTGTAAGSELTDYYLSLSQTLDDSATLIGSSSEDISLAQGESITETPVLTIPATLAAGTYYLIAQGDADGSLAISNPSTAIAVGGPIRIGSTTDPTVTSVTAQPGAGNNWAFTIQGSSFGTAAAYSNGDNAWLNLNDSTQDFSAGYTGDAITASVTSWSNTEIQISGLAGAYGQLASTIEPGDELTVVIGNPQTGGTSLPFSFTAAQLASASSSGPIIHAPATESMNENGTLTFSAADGNAITVDDEQAQGAYEQLEISATGGTFSLGGTSGLAVSAGATGSSETVTGTLANLNNALNGLTFTPTSGTNGKTSLHFTLTNEAVTTLGSLLSASGTIGITVSAPLPQGGSSSPADTEIDFDSQLNGDSWTLSYTEGDVTKTATVDFSLIDDILDATAVADQIESDLGEIPGWHLQTYTDKTPNYSLDVAGSLFFTPGGTLDNGSTFQLGISADEGAQVEGYFGLSVLNIGVGVGLDVGLNLAATAAYSNGDWTFGGEGDAEGTLTGFAELTAGTVQGEAFVQGSLSGKLTASADGQVTAGLTLGGDVGLALNHLHLITGDPPTTITSTSYPLGSISTSPWTFNVGQLANDFVNWANQDFIASSGAASAEAKLSNPAIGSASAGNSTVSVAAPLSTVAPADDVLSGISSYAVNTLASFSSTSGANPQTGLILDSDGNLYGVSTTGGVNGEGDVFEISADTDEVTTLASFDGADGAGPVGSLLIDGQGNLYGTIEFGGDSNGDGTVFEIVKGSNSITTLASFNGADGANPVATLVADRSGNLYGTTTNGGANGYGTVFEIAEGGNSIATLASFGWTTGTYPYSGLVIDSDGNLYGTTRSGGATDDGTVFELASGRGVITTLVTFDGDDGAHPYGALISDTDGNLYGTTEDGGDVDGDGTVFEIPAGTSTITTLATFDGADGANPFGALILDGNGDLYGTASRGGAEGYGTIFAVAKGSGTITDLASLDWSNGAGPTSSLVADKGGDLFGTAQFGGTSGVGTAFELSPMFEANLAGSAMYIKLDADGVHADVWNNASGTGSIAESLLLSDVSSIGFIGTGSSNALVIDFSNGDPLPSGGLSIGSAAGSVALQIIGTSGADTVTVDGSTITIAAGFGSASITYSNVGSITFSGGGDDVLNQMVQPGGGASLAFSNSNANDTLNVYGGTFIFPASQMGEGITPITLGVLKIADGASVSVADAPDEADRDVLVLGSLSVAGGGLMDLSDNDLIVTSGDLGDILGQIATGVNFSAGGAWNSASGITSDVAESVAEDAANLHKTAIGYATAGALGLSSFDGVSVAATAIVAGCRFDGDANLDGTVNALDFNALATNYGKTGMYWFNGDFNYDGTVDSNDFAALAANYGEVMAGAGQTSVLSNAKQEKAAAVFSDEQMITEWGVDSGESSSVLDEGV